jgi:hypothetical protein
MCYRYKILDNTRILNFLNIMFGLLQQKDGHLNELELLSEGCILLIQLLENIIIVACFL